MGLFVTYSRAFMHASSVLLRSQCNAMLSGISYYTVERILKVIRYGVCEAAI